MLNVNFCSTVGGLSRWSIKAALEKVDHDINTNGDTPCTLSPGIPLTPAKPATAVSAPTMHWVSPWRTRAIHEDSSDLEEGVSELDSEEETDSLTKEWESQPKSLRQYYVADDKDWETGSDSEVDIYMGEEEYSQKRGAWPKNDRAYEGDWEEEEEEQEGGEEEEEECDSSSLTEYFHALKVHFPLLRKGQQTTGHSWGSEPELEYLRDGESEKLLEDSSVLATPF